MVGLIFRSGLAPFDLCGFISCLGWLGDDYAVPMLLPFLDAETPSVSATALSALQRITGLNQKGLNSFFEDARKAAAP